MDDIIAARDGLPGCRVVPRFTAITLRHFAGDTSARDAAQQIGLAWSDMPGKLAGADPWLVWRSPQETIAVGLEDDRLRQLLELLAPGRSETAMAADLSEALAVIELHGPMLDEWLAHLVDGMSIPRQPGLATRARLADAAVMLLRLAMDRVWLIADRPIRPYLENWLAYSHEGAFSGSQAGQRT